MLYPLIIQLIVYLSIVVLISVSTANNNNADVRLKHTKIEILYPKEEVLLNASEMYIESGLTDLAGLATLDIATIQATDYLNNNFSLTNGFSGTVSIDFVDGGRSLRVMQSIDDANARFIYKNHYKSKKYSITPVDCVTNSSDYNYCPSDDGSGTYVYHDYPLRIETTTALGL